MIYPVALHFSQGTDIQIFVIIVEATNKWEANGKGQAIAARIQQQYKRYQNQDLYVRVGTPGVSDPDSPITLVD